MNSPWLLKDWKSKNILADKHKSDLERGEQGHQTLHASDMKLTKSDVASGEAVLNLSLSEELMMKDSRKSFFPVDCSTNIFAP